MTLRINKSDIFPIIDPGSIPTSIRHFFNKIILAKTILLGIHDRMQAINHITFSFVLFKQMVFIFAPCSGSSNFKFLPVKMFSLFRHM